MGLTARLLWLGLLPGLLIMLALGWLLDSSIRDSLYGGMALRLNEHADRIQAGLERDDNGRWYDTASRSSGEFSQIFSGWYWQLQSPGQSLYSRSLWDATLEKPGANAPAGLLRASGPMGLPLLGLERFVDGGVRLLIYAPAQEVSADLSRIRQILVFALAMLLFSSVLAALVQVRVGLRPLQLLRQRLAALRSSDGQLSGSLACVDDMPTVLGSGYGPDLDPLAQEVDALLERNARMLARGRAHAADLSHALKTPLARLSVEAGRSEVVPVPLVLAQVDSINKLIERHLTRATTASDSAVALRQAIPVREVLVQLIQLMRQIHQARALAWVLQAEHDLLWRGDRADLEEMLGNLLDNAGKWAVQQVQVSLQQGWDGKQEGCKAIVICIEDDGPGIPEQHLLTAGRRGQRFDESTPGSGLGLSIVADIVHTWNGRLKLARSASLGGLAISLILPAP